MSQPPSNFASTFRPGRPGQATLLLLHGTGGNEHDLVPIAERVLPGASLLGVRGQVSEGGALRFFRRHAEGVLDLDDLRWRADGLATWLRAQMAERGLTQVIALGFSNGANVASALLFQHPGLVAGAALLRPMAIYDPVPVPALGGTRVLLSAGRADPLVPVRQVEALASQYRAARADVTLAWQSAGHALATGDLATMAGFLGPWAPSAG